MGKLVSIAAGLALGAAFGAATVLLLTPRSGEETKQMIRGRFEEIVAEGQRAAESRRLELTERFETLKQPVAQV